MSVAVYTINIDEFAKIVIDLLKKDFSLEGDSPEGFSKIIGTFAKKEEEIQITNPDFSLLKGIDIISEIHSDFDVKISFDDKQLVLPIRDGKAYLPNPGIDFVGGEYPITILSEEEVFVSLIFLQPNKRSVGYVSS